MKCKCKNAMTETRRQAARDKDSYSDYLEHIEYRCENCGITAITTGGFMIDWIIPKILQKKYGKSKTEFRECEEGVETK